MKIALIGAGGQLGFDLAKKLDKTQSVFLDLPEFDITEPENVSDVLKTIDPAVVINTAAFNRVDECEHNPGLAEAINTAGVKNLVRVCSETGAILVHFSTDYVFDGGKKTPYTEDDPPHPLNVYGRTKMEGERYVQQGLVKYCLIRTSGLYGEAGCWGKGFNFVDFMTGASKRQEPVRVVCDQTLTPTATEELAERVIELIESEEFGLFHMTNEGFCTWYEFAKTIFSFLGADEAKVEPVTSAEYGAAAARPAYSVLENSHAKQIGIRSFSLWKEALEKYLIAKGYLT